MTTCEGFSSYFRFGCYIEDWASAVPRGFAKGGGEGVNQAIKDAIDNIDLSGFGSKFGTFVNNEAKNFFDSANIDPDSFSASAAKTINQLHTAFFKNLDLRNIGRTFGDSMEAGWDGFDLPGRFQTAGSDIRDAMNEFTWELGEGLQESLSNVLTGVRNELIFNQMPYFLGAGLLATVVCVGTPLALYYLYHRAKYNIGRPKLATEVNQIGLSKLLMSPISSVFSLFKSKTVKPVYDTETTRRINEISNAIQNTRKNGGYFPNVIFYGPGGTGKTMISHLLAEESGMSYIKMSGGDLAQYIKRGEHVTELNKLFDSMERSWRPWSVRPWALFIDEAESLCKDRSKLPSSELLELQNAFLNRTGVQSKKFMMVLATNRLEDLDQAVINRMDYKVHIGPPKKEERVEIIKSHLPQFFSKKETQDPFNEEAIQWVAEKTEGFTGRSLFKLLNAIANKKAATKANKLTKELIEQTVQDFVQQEEQVEKLRSAAKQVE